MIYSKNILTFMGLADNGTNALLKYVNLPFSTRIKDRHSKDLFTEEFLRWTRQMYEKSDSYQRKMTRRVETIMVEMV